MAGCVETTAMGRSMEIEHHVGMWLDTGRLLGLQNL